MEEADLGSRSADRTEGAAVRRFCPSEEEAIIVAFRRHTLLPLDDCLYALQPTIPHLTRSSLHRCLQRHGISRLPDVEGDKPPRRSSSATRSATSTSTLPRCRRPKASSISSWPSTARPSSPSSRSFERRPNVSSAFLVALIEAVPYKIHTVLTDNGIQFTFPPRYADGPTARYMTHMFDMRCRENGIEHRLTKVKHPWTNGQVERMNRTIKEATVKALPLRRPRPVRSPSRRLHRRLQFRPTTEDPQGPHTLRVHLQSWTSSPNDSTSIRSIKCRD